MFTIRQTIVEARQQALIHTLNTCTGSYVLIKTVMHACKYICINANAVMYARRHTQSGGERRVRENELNASRKSQRS